MAQILQALQGAIKDLEMRSAQQEREAAQVRDDLTQKIQVARMPKDEAMRAIAAAQVRGSLADDCGLSVGVDNGTVIGSMADTASRKLQPPHRMIVT